MSGHYALDRRTASDIRRELRAAAERAVVRFEDGSAHTWASVLFSGDDWADAAEPSQALLEAFVELQAGLAAHRNRVPGRVQAAWLRERLGIAPLAGVPDRVVVAVTADPARTPLAIDAGTAVRAKDSAGADRRYTTAETLTVHGIELIDARSYRAERVGDGPVRDHADRWADRGLPFAPFAGGEPAVHRFIVLSDLLAFPDGDLVARLVFAGGDARALDGAVWEFPAPGAVEVATRLSSSATAVDLKLSGGCTPAPILGTEATYLCASLPATGWSPDALGLATSGVTVEVLERKGVRPDAALYNDGRLDPTREMQPFGPAPRRGDAFYVRSDEAFAKPLRHLKVRLALLEADHGVLSEVAWSPISATKRKAAEAKAREAATRFGTVAGSAIRDILDLLGSDAEPRVEWQRRLPSGWDELTSTADELKTVEWNGSTPAGKPFSHPVDPARPEHLVRAFLAEGDFGWSDYEEGIATFAAQAAGPTATPDASLLVPPDPPILSSLSLEYKTHAAPPAAIVSEDGWTTRRPPATGAYHPFTVPLDISGDAAGMVAFGLRISAAALGSTVSLYFDVESAPACGTGPDSPLEWEYWAGDAEWQPLDVADGTLGLRQRGLLRFVAPPDWPDGCPGASAADGRWIRAVTTEPDSVGAILAVIPDAVEAVRVAGEPVSAEPLAAGQVKGFLAAKAGIKKATNRLEGIAGRTPEDPEDPRYLRRAGGAVRHRWRACMAWDHETLVREAFPELAAVRCLPHTAPDGWTAPGWVGLVLIPRSTDPMPLPGVGLAGRVEAALRPRLPVHAQVAVLCPLYVPVRVEAEVALVRGVAAVDARDRITGALERRLHPTAEGPPRFGHELFASTVAAWLESLDDVDHLDAFALLVDDVPVERVAVDPCRGLTASAGAHRLVLEERL